MPRTFPEKQIIPLIKSAVNSLIEHPVILYPLSIGAFIQLLALEILYFAPRYPLSEFFGPLIRNRWGEMAMHYPYNFFVLPKMFYTAQVTIYFIIGSFLSALTIYIIAALNSDKKVTLRLALREMLPWYIYIFLAGLIYGIVFFSLTDACQLILAKVLLMIKSHAGLFSLAKKVVVFCLPFLNWFVGVFVTVIFAFYIPIIVLEKKKFWASLGANFRFLWKSFWFIFMVVLLPSLLYLPIILLRGNIAKIVNDGAMPGVEVVRIIVSIFITLIIDGLILTATTTYYLLKRESQ